MSHVSWNGLTHVLGWTYLESKKWTLNPDLRRKSCWSKWSDTCPGVEYLKSKKWILILESVEIIGHMSQGGHILNPKRGFSSLIWCLTFVLGWTYLESKKKILIIDSISYVHWNGGSRRCAYGMGELWWWLCVILCRFGGCLEDFGCCGWQCSVRLFFYFFY